jgi:putative transposase
MRTALDGYPFGDVEKDELVKIIKRFSRLFFVNVFGYCILVE